MLRFVTTAKKPTQMGNAALESEDRERLVFSADGPPPMTLTEWACVLTCSGIKRGCSMGIKCICIAIHGIWYQWLRGATRRELALT